MDEEEEEEEMMMRMKTSGVAVSVMLMMAFGTAVVQMAEAQDGVEVDAAPETPPDNVDVVNAPAPAPAPLGTIGTPLFTGCAGKTGRELFGCYQSSFKPYIAAKDTQGEKCYVDGTYTPDNAPCPACPAYPECGALGGLCLPSTTPAGEPSNFNPVSEVIDDCPTGSTCVYQKGSDTCTDPNDPSDTSQCSCADAGGYILDQSDCQAQCGTFTAHKSADSGTSPPPGTVGLPAPTVCCKPAGSCPDFHTKSCFDGSACYYGECTANGKFTCPEGTGEPVDNAGHPVCDD